MTGGLTTGGDVSGRFKGTGGICSQKSPKTEGSQCISNY